MVKRVIRMKIDANEQNSERAKKLEKIVSKKSKEFEFCGYHNLLSDVEFSIDGHTVHVELKEKADLVSSVLSGHLPHQVLNIQTKNEPAFIAVLGSAAETLDTISRINKQGYRGKDAIANDKNRIRSFCSDSYSIGVPVFFWDAEPMEWVVSHAKNILLESDILDHLPKPRECSVQEAMFCMIPGIGAATSKKIIKRFGKFDQLPWKNVNKEKIEKLIGSHRAEKICRIFENSS